MVHIKSTWKEKLPTPLSNDEIVGFIYKTYDFDKFDTTAYNRDISEGHVAKLKASFAERDLGIASPVKTNEHSEVIDGGHTLEARKQGNFPLYHIIIEGTSAEKDIARLNMTRKDWTYEDWINHYVTRHNNSEDKTRFINYILFQNFRSEHDFSMGVQLNLFTLNHNTKAVYSQIKAGTIAHPDPTETQDRAAWLGLASEIVKNRGVDFSNAMLFVYADLNVDNEYFLGKLQDKKDTITAQKRNATDWINWVDEFVIDGNFMRNKAFTGDKDGFHFRKGWKEYQDAGKRMKKKANKEQE
jgi:hypothetical protein